MHQAQATGEGGIERPQLRVDARGGGIGDAHLARQPQGLEDGAIGRQHRADGEVVGMLPFERAVHMIVHLAGPLGHFEEMQAHIGVLVVMLAHQPGPASVRGDAQLFVELAHQGGACILAGLDLAAGKLPIALV